MLSKIQPLTLLGLLFLTGCGEKEDIVPGIRLDLRSSIDAPVLASKNLTLSKVKINNNWTHRNGSQSHYIEHPA